MTERVVDDHMRAYYDRRAPEYDDWWLGTGRFEQIDRPGWDEEVEQLVALLRGLPPARTLDVACGTGFLTRHLPGAVVGLDQSLSMLDVAARQAPAALLVQGDAVPLPFGDGEFERLHASHFYGHLLPDERTAFLAEARRVAGELVIVDAAGDGTEWETRTLDDGSQHQVYKRRFTGAGSRPSSAAARCCTTAAGSSSSARDRELRRAAVADLEPHHLGAAALHDRADPDAADALRVGLPVPGRLERDVELVLRAPCACSARRRTPARGACPRTCRGGGSSRAAPGRPRRGRRRAPAAGRARPRPLRPGARAGGSGP